MVKFLAGPELTAEIRQVCGGDNLCVASAFWGTGAAKFIGPAAKSGRFLADLTMGGTNPDELRELGAPRNERVKAAPSLHAKVYISSLGAVVGSANLSQDGIGWLDDPHLVEAGISLSADHPECEEIRGWFEKMFTDALPIDEASLANAQRRWDMRRMGRDQDKGIASLTPQQQSQWGWVLWERHIPRDRQDELVSELAEKLGNPVEMGDFEIYDDWEEDQIAKWPDYFISISPKNYGIALRQKVHVLDRTVFARKLFLKDYPHFKHGWGRNFSRLLKNNGQHVEQYRGSVLTAAEAAELELNIP